MFKDVQVNSGLSTLTRYDENVQQEDTLSYRDKVPAELPDQLTCQMEGGSNTWWIGASSRRARMRLESGCHFPQSLFGW